ncbi:MULTISPECIES: hypothetical protein [unclassified Oceanispirochaeta]|uniref:hypothetical protein n=1 Tax=unclassified Oceanispirochaeta TaxID=2635722 RepID=UPI000E0926D3|nr:MULTISPECIES: hypothetical protein [unclassified Oceanispirochaeta]MBF9016041.1 hypothetical protein [Oceanispirochaeta sp. M2]NPD72504.1 hypothetical protein [Oceanispirochaeta sp. M1]RDG31962.1 hypothetical protein DV872_10365 [Oceanispirochaeta sp. M1]
MYTYCHYCFTSKTIPEGAEFVESLGCYVTDFEKHPLKFEFIYIDESSVLPNELRDNPHIAYYVDNFDEMIEKEKVLYQFIAPDGSDVRVAFLMIDGVVVEIKEKDFSKTS